MNSILRYRYFLLLSFSVLINLGAYLKQGTRLVNDSYRYIEYAEQIALGNLYQEHNIWYFGYCAFLAFFIKFNLSFDFAILTQCLLSVLSILALYKACEYFTGNRKKAFFSSILYLAFFEISLWNDYILTESLFISFTCLSLYFLSLYHQKSTIKNLSILLFVLLIVFWLRPMGICLLAGFGFYFYIEKIQGYLAKPVQISIVLITVIFSFLLINEMLRTFHLVENYATGEVVFGISRIPNYAGHEYILLKTPQNLYLPTKGGTFLKALSFYFHNPWYAFKLSFLKGFYFLTHFKPYNSLLHNLHTLLIILPCYAGLFIWLREKGQVGIKSFVLGTILSSTAIIMLSSEDWDGRFFMGIAPLIFCFAFANKKLFSSFWLNEKLD